MTTSRSETLNEQLINRICEWAKARKLAEPDIDMIIDLVAALRVAGKRARRYKSKHKGRKHKVVSLVGARPDRTVIQVNGIIWPGQRPEKYSANGAVFVTYPQKVTVRFTGVARRDA